MPSQPHLLFACLALCVSACGSGGDEKTDRLPGATLFIEKRCVFCHGERGAGRGSAPPLRDLRTYFTPEQLISYLRNPKAYARQNERLRVLQDAYPESMPGFDTLEARELQKLAEYVLAL